MPRLFFALLPSPQSRDALRALAVELARSTGARVVPAPDLHLTLCFLGPVPAERPLQVLEGLAPTRPPTVDLDALDYWPGPRVLCATVVPQDVNCVATLAAGIRTALRGFDPAPGDKPFIPHVTLARRPGRQALGQSWPRALDPVLRVRFDELALLESRPGIATGEPRYAPLGIRTLIPATS